MDPKPPKLKFLNQLCFNTQAFKVISSKQPHVFPSKVARFSTTALQKMKSESQIVAHGCKL